MARTVDPRKHAARREEILGAALLCFATNGFERTTTAQICRMAGIGSGTLFHYFPNKRAILHAGFALDIDRSAERAREALAYGNPLQGVWFFIEDLTADVVEREYLGLVFVATQEAMRDPELAAIFTQLDGVAVGALTELVERAIQDRQIDPGHDPALTAAWIYALTDTLYLRLAGDPSLDTATERMLMRDVIARFLRVRD